MDFVRQDPMLVKNVDKLEFVSHGNRKVKKMETFGARLQVLRKGKNLSQEAFAEIMDVSRQSISKWENDNAYPEMSKLILMSRYFDVTIDYLVLGNDPAETTANETASLSKMDSLLKTVNTFFSNLSDKQKFVVALFCVSIIAIGLAAIYGGGYVIGKALYHLNH